MARGLFSSMQQLAREAERQQAQQRRAAAKTQRDRDRAAKQALRSEESRRKQETAEAKALLVEERQVEVESMNAALEESNEEIANLLSASLSVDSYFDLNTLRREVVHPPFGKSYLEQPIRKPVLPEDSPEPQYVEPKPSRALFGKRKKNETAIASAKATHADAKKDWRLQLEQNAAQRKKQMKEYEKAESSRIEMLQEEKTIYSDECTAREQEILEFNSSIDSLISNLSYGTSDAVETNFSIVFSHSQYPEHFPVSHKIKFDPSNSELSLKILIPPPSELEIAKVYKYVKKSDQITSTELSQKARKDRYTSAIQQVLLRSINETYQADRRGLVKTVSVKLGTETTNPATGKQGFIPLAGVAAERDAFLEFDLLSVVPKSTLDFLGASISKNPHGLVAVDTAGVRHS